MTKFFLKILVFRIFLFIHSSIIIICGGFATLDVVTAVAVEDVVIAVEFDANIVDATPPATTVGVEVSLVSNFSSNLSLVVGNVCAANCHFDGNVGSPTRW